MVNCYFTAYNLNHQYSNFNKYCIVKSRCLNCLAHLIDFFTIRDKTQLANGA